MSNTVKVGVFAVVALSVLGYLIFKVEDLRLWQDEGQRIDATFESVAGLDDKAAVRVAGVRVGRVDGVRLEGTRAVVTLLLDQPIDLRADAYATISSLGLLGDKYVQLAPGSPGAPPLPDGQVLEGRTPLAWDDAVAQLSGIGESIEGALEGLDPKASGETIRSLLANLEATSETVRALVASNREDLSSTIGNFETFSATLATEIPKLTAQMERVLLQVESVVADNREVLGESLENIAEISGSMQTSIDNLNQITTQIASGEGTIGKFINSDEAHDQLTSTLSAVESGVASLADTIGRVQKMRLDLDFDGYLLEESDETRTSFSLSLFPQDSNRFYRIGAVDDPRGRLSRRTDVVTVTGPDGESSTTTTTTQTRDDDIGLSAQFGFRFGSADLRAGLFESTGGAAVDYRLFKDRLRLSLEAFDFNREEDLDPHLRITSQWRLHPNLYLLAGYDDLLLSDRDSLFVGGGVRWTDEDFKYLLGSLPVGR